MDLLALSNFVGNSGELFETYEKHLRQLIPRAFSVCSDRIWMTTPQKPGDKFLTKMILFLSLGRQKFLWTPIEVKVVEESFTTPMTLANTTQLDQKSLFSLTAPAQRTTVFKLTLKPTRLLMFPYVNFYIA